MIKTLYFDSLGLSPVGTVGPIWEVPEPVPPSEHRIKYQLVYVRDSVRVVGYDNERGKGDHKHRYDTELPYVFNLDSSVDRLPKCVASWF